MCVSRAVGREIDTVGQEVGWRLSGQGPYDPENEYRCYVETGVGRAVDELQHWYASSRGFLYKPSGHRARFARTACSGLNLLSSSNADVFGKSPKVPDCHPVFLRTEFFDASRDLVYFLFRRVESRLNKTLSHGM